MKDRVKIIIRHDHLLASELRNEILIFKVLRMEKFKKFGHPAEYEFTAGWKDTVTRTIDPNLTFRYLQFSPTRH